MIRNIVFDMGNVLIDYQLLKFVRNSLAALNGHYWIKGSSNRRLLSARSANGCQTPCVPVQKSFFATGSIN
mgnify:CR=1 FL=1